MKLGGQGGIRHPAIARLRHPALLFLEPVPRPYLLYCSLLNFICYSIGILDYLGQCHIFTIQLQSLPSGSVPPFSMATRLHTAV